MFRKFLFVTPLTPARLLTPIRRLLFQEFINALKAQSYENWEAILIGEEERTDGKIRYLKVGAETKEIKLIFATQFIQAQENKPHYIIRIDDDDIINPNLLQFLRGKHFDCFADKYHTFYDLISGKISQQQRDFLANTVVHEISHALSPAGEDKIPLIQSDHSSWIKYYENKTLLYAHKSFPVYLRVLSPTTVTNGIYQENGDISTIYNNFKSKIIKLKSYSDIDLQSYEKYLRSHGQFRSKEIESFKNAMERLKNAWESFAGKKVKISVVERIRKLWGA